MSGLNPFHFMKSSTDMKSDGRAMIVFSNSIFIIN